MKHFICFSILVLCFSATTYAQDAKNARVSPLNMARTVFKDTYLKVTYSQPAKNGRVIFGELVPYGKIWRTGANEATEITITKDIYLQGTLIKPGTYSLFTIPQPIKWTIILNAEVGLWGDYNYNERKDVVRFDAPVTTNDKTFERFTIDFVQKNDSAELLLMWDNVKVSIPIRYIN
jgi:hypothetical protein